MRTCGPGRGRAERQLLWTSAGPEELAMVRVEAEISTGTFLNRWEELLAAMQARGAVGQLTSVVLDSLLWEMEAARGLSALL